MKNYSVVVGSYGPKKVFSVTFGLLEGWGQQGGVVHTIEEAVQAGKACIARQATGAGQNDFILSGVFTPGHLIYAWPGGSGDEANTVFSGEVKPLYANRGGRPITKEELVELLNEFASEVGGTLGQKRVYVSLGDETWIIQQDESVTPTGETA